MEKRLLLLLVFFLCFSVSAIAEEKKGGVKKEMPKSLPGITTISAEALKKWLDEEEEFFLLDVNKKSIYDTNHLPEAEHCIINTGLSLDKKLVAETKRLLEQCEALKEADKDGKIVVYCMSPKCALSPRAAMALQQMNFSQIYWYRGGINVWKKKSFPTEEE